jgi:hypothetical protein
MHLFTQQLIPAEIMNDIKNYNAMTDSCISKSMEDITPDLVMPIVSIPEIKRIKCDPVDESKSLLIKVSLRFVIDARMLIFNVSF